MYFFISDEPGLPFVVEDTNWCVGGDAKSFCPDDDAKGGWDWADFGVGMIAGERNLLTIVIVLLFAPLYIHEFD